MLRRDLRQAVQNLLVLGIPLEDIVELGHCPRRLPGSQQGKDQKLPRLDVFRRRGQRGPQHFHRILRLGPF